MSDRDERFEGIDGQQDDPRGASPNGYVPDVDTAPEGPAEQDGGGESSVDDRDSRLAALQAERDEYARQVRESQQFVQTFREEQRKQQLQKFQSQLEEQRKQRVEQARDMEPEQAIQFLADQHAAEMRRVGDELRQEAQRNEYVQRQNQYRGELGAYAEKRVGELELDDDSKAWLAQSLSALGDIRDERHRDDIGEYIEKTTKMLADQQAARNEAKTLREAQALAQQRDGRTRRGADRAGSGGGRAPKDYSQSANPMRDMIGDMMAGAGMLRPQ